MSEDDRNLYYDGINRTQKTLQMCDYATTSTETIALELKKYVKEVFVSRNSFDESLLKRSFDARLLKKDKNDIYLGYFSGSATHNLDFEMIANPVLKILEKYSNVKLLIVGHLDLPSSFDKFKERVEYKNFVPFKELQNLIAEVDINLAPLTDTLFNNAKSEIKYTEAALIKTPSVASPREAFLTIIKDGVNGFVAQNEEEWFEKISNLVEDKKLRNDIADKAFSDVEKKYSTKNIGIGLSKFLKSHMAPKVAYIIPTDNIAGGQIVNLKHVNELQNRGYNTLLISHDTKLHHNIDWFPNQNVPIVSGSALDDAHVNIDILVSTLWTTVDQMRNYSFAKRKIYLVQNKEQFFYKPGTFTFDAAEATYSFHDIEYFTISKWCEDWLKKEYNQDSTYIPNGLDTTMFYPEKNKISNKRIIIEGNSTDDYKNVDEAFQIIDKLKDDIEVWYVSYGGEKKDWYKVDKSFNKIPLAKMRELYVSCDILLKTSKLESFSYPPMEMMACGGVCVVAENGGNKEYVIDEYNALTYKVGDIEMAVKQIQRLLSDNNLCEKLRQNGFETVKGRDWKVVIDQLEKAYFPA